MIIRVSFLFGSVKGVALTVSVETHCLFGSDREGRWDRRNCSFASRAVVAVKDVPACISDSAVIRALLDNSQDVKDIQIVQFSKKSPCKG